MQAFTGKTALVTGAGSGIGLATATLLARSGAALAMIDVDEAAVERAASELGGAAIVADVGDPDVWPGIVDAAAEVSGGIDLVHLNAGVSTDEQDIATLSDEAYRRIMRVNVDGVVYGIRALVPALARRGGGAMVATASLAGLIGFSPDPIYCLTKHAVVGLVRSLVPQLSEHKITIDAVCPSIVDTPLIAGTRQMLHESGFPLIEPASVAEAVLSCLGDGESGRAMVVQAGREAIPYRFGRPPGPRSSDQTGQLPPTEYAAHDQR